MENSNRLIAEFMEMTPCLTDKGDFLIKGNPIEAKYLPYTTSWDWIMPVVMKISRKIDKPLDEVVSRLTEVGSDNIWDVKSLHNAVVEFINNQNN